MSSVSSLATLQWLHAMDETWCRNHNNLS